MNKIDLRKELKHLYAPSANKVEVVDVPAFQFVMIDGEIPPGEAPGTSLGFSQAIEALYGASYTLKFMSKLRKTNPIDYAVMALEGLWWIEAGHFDLTSKTQEWKFTLMMMQPEHITEEMFSAALQQLKSKKDNPAFDQLRLEKFHEGLCMQIMHIGPYAEEPRTIELMKKYAEENGYVLHGKHHEIYMGDPRRAKPETLKTILRQPIQKAE